MRGPWFNRGGSLHRIIPFGSAKKKTSPLGSPARDERNAGVHESLEDPQPRYEAILAANVFDSELEPADYSLDEPPMTMWQKNLSSNPYGSRGGAVQPVRVSPGGASRISGFTNLESLDSVDEDVVAEAVEVTLEIAGLLRDGVMTGPLRCENRRDLNSGETKGKKSRRSKKESRATLAGRMLTWGQNERLRVDDIVALTYSEGSRRFTVHAFPCQKRRLIPGVLRKVQRQRKDINFLAPTAADGHRWTSAFADLGCFIHLNARSEIEELAEGRVGMEGVPEIKLRRAPSVMVVINPRSGHGRGRRVFDNFVKPVLELAGFQLKVQETKHARHAEELATSLDLEECPDGIICVGGDGIVSEVLNGLFARKDKEAMSVPIGIIPAGSDNSLCWSVLGIRDAASAALLIVKGGTVPVDAFAMTWGSTGMMYMGLTIAYYGFMSDVLQLSTKYHKRFGPLRYAVAGAQCLLKMRSYDVDVEFIPMGEAGSTVAVAEADPLQVIAEPLRGPADETVAHEERSPFVDGALPAAPPHPPGGTLGTIAGVVGSWTAGGAGYDRLRTDRPGASAGRRPPDPSAASGGGAPPPAVCPSPARLHPSLSGSPARLHSAAMGSPARLHSMGCPAGSAMPGSFPSPGGARMETGVGMRQLSFDEDLLSSGYSVVGMSGELSPYASPAQGGGAGKASVPGQERYTPSGPEERMVAGVPPVVLASVSASPSPSRSRARGRLRGLSSVSSTTLGSIVADEDNDHSSNASDSEGRGVLATRLAVAGSAEDSATCAASQTGTASPDLESATKGHPVNAPRASPSLPKAKGKGIGLSNLSVHGLCGGGIEPVRTPKPEEPFVGADLRHGDGQGVASQKDAADTSKWVRKEGPFLCVMACNHRCKSVQCLDSQALAPLADKDDGGLDLLLVKRVSRLQLIRFLLYVQFGAHLSLPFVEYTKTKSVRLIPRDAQHKACGVDGELLPLEEPVTTSVLPTQCRLMGQSSHSK